MDDAPMLDREHLSMLMRLEEGEGSGMLVRMFQLYLDSIPPQLTRMREALGTGDQEALAREVHALAGSSGMYGMPRVRQCCLQLEGHLRGRAPGDAGELLSAVEHAFEQTRLLLMAELTQGA